MGKITRNAIRCKHCGEIIESQYTHDFVTCKCGSCSVDGGHSYLRRCFHTSPDVDFEDLSCTEDDTAETKQNTKK